MKFRLACICYCEWQSNLDLAFSCPCCGWAPRGGIRAVAQVDDTRHGLRSFDEIMVDWFEDFETRLDEDVA